jgi:hypothetical protein
LGSQGEVHLDEIRIFDIRPDNNRINIPPRP